MLAAVFEGVGQVATREVPDPRIESATDAVVRIRAAGVCGSDLWYFRGLDPISAGARLGHEFVGVVEETGSEVSGVRAGDHVVAPFSYSDGTCPACARNLPTSCVNGGMWGGEPSPGGAQAEAIRVPFADANLVRLPTEGDEDSVRYLSLADVLPTAQHAVTCGEVGPQSSLVIVGDGPIGLATVLAARRLGVERLVVLGHHQARLAMAEKFGAADTALSPGTPAEVTDLVNERLGDRATTVIDCVGTQASVDLGLASVRDGGVFAFVGLPVTGAQVTLLDTFDRNLTIRGGIAPARTYIPTLMNDIADGLVDPSPILDLKLPLTDVQAGYAAMDERRATKTVLCP